MTDKPEFVDMISEATRQNAPPVDAAHRRTPDSVQGNLASRPLAAGSWEQWRMETLTPWKIKPWGGKDWD